MRLSGDAQHAWGTIFYLLLGLLETYPTRAAFSASDDGSDGSSAHQVYGHGTLSS